MEIQVKIKRAAGALPPGYQTPLAAGCDLHAFLGGSIVLEPGERAAVPTGIHLEIPEGFEAQVRPRSGLALKFGVTCLNSPGTIDADYRGEIKVILANLGNEPFAIHSGDRIAQMVFAPCLQARFEDAPDLSETERGKGGFGSTGS